MNAIPPFNDTIERQIRPQDLAQIRQSSSVRWLQIKADGPEMIGRLLGEGSLFDCTP